MLDIQLIRENPDRVREGMLAKGEPDASAVDDLLSVDEERRAVVTELQEMQRRSNEISGQIGQLMQSGEREKAQELIEESGQLKVRIQEAEERARMLDEKQSQLLLAIPNVPHESVPVGHSEEENEVLREEGERTSFSFDALPHWELTERHGLVDFDRGSKVSGAGFPFYIGKGARLQRALLNFFLDQAGERGYREMQPPILINPDSAMGTGQLPDKEDLMYEIMRDELYPIPTAEVPVTNFHRDEILDEEELPRKYCAFTPCFRREAGSHGADVRGLNRLHQFDKVELVHFVRPEDSYAALEELRDDAERLLQLLDLPYRVLSMCTGDMGFTQAKKYDLEVWSAGQERWLEVSSVSNFEAYQARRMQIRYRPKDGRPQPLHTLNGSGLAFPRVVAALLENNQREDGSIVLPEIIAEYTGFESIG